MKFAAILCLVSFICIAAAPINAQCPITGVYSTYMGNLLSGRASEAYCGADGEPIQPGRPGNTQNAESWNNAALGTQWKVWGMYIDGNGGVETGRNVDEFGNGYIDYETNYLGGQFWLSKDHSWGDGLNDLTGHIDYYNVSTRITLSGGQVSGYVSNVYFTGKFYDCEECWLRYVIANAMLVWMPGWPDGPLANYPDLLCDATLGEQIDVCCIQADIYCDIATEESTWGAIKSLYR